MPVLSRQQERATFSPETRLTLSENDLDRLEVMVDDLRGDLKAIRNLLMGLFISVCTGCVMLVINLLVGPLHH